MLSLHLRDFVSYLSVCFFFYSLCLYFFSVFVRLFVSSSPVFLFVFNICRFLVPELFVQGLVSNVKKLLKMKIQRKTDKVMWEKHSSQNYFKYKKGLKLRPFGMLNFTYYGKLGLP